MEVVQEGLLPTWKKVGSGSWRFFHNVDSINVFTLTGNSHSHFYIERSRSAHF